MEPDSLFFGIKEDAHPRMRGIRYKMIDQEAIVFDSNLLNFAVRDGPVPIKDKLGSKVNAFIEFIKILHHTTFIPSVSATQFFLPKLFLQ